MNSLSYFYKKIIKNIFSRRTSSQRFVVFLGRHRRTGFQKWKKNEKRKLWKFFHRNTFKSIFVVCAVFVLIIVIIKQSTVIKAEAVKFYPNVCLGGWQNVKNAEGKPELPEDAVAEEFSEKNSAVLGNSVSQIFCSDFTGEIPKDTQIKTLLLRLSWSLGGETPNLRVEPQNESATTSVLVYPSDDVSLSIQKIIDAPASSTLQISSEDMPSEKGANINKELETKDEATVPEIHTEVQNLETTLAPAEVVLPVPHPLPPPEASAEIPPVSLFNRFFQYALAEGTTTEQAVGETKPFPSEFLEVYYTLDGAEWHSLGKVSRADWKTEFKIPVTEWDDISKLQVSIQSRPSVDELPEVYLDAMWLEADYVFFSPSSGGESLSEDEKRKFPQRDDFGLFNKGQKDFRADEDVVFELPNNSSASLAASSTPDTIDAVMTPTETSLTSTKEMVPENIPSAETMATGTSAFFDFFGSFVLFSSVRAQALNETIILAAEVFDGGGKATGIVPFLETGGGKTRIKVPRQGNSFRPGKYRLRAEILMNGEIIRTEQDFTWGVLAINMNKSMYLHGEEAYLQMAALNDTGHTLCDADLRLEIEDPNLQKTIFQTADGTMEKSEGDTGCGPNNVTDNPDYFARYIATSTGVYHATLTNVGNGYAVSDTFNVQNEIPYEVERVGATRINPFLSDYLMTFRVKANSDFKGVITEKTPKGFEITPTASSFSVKVMDSPDGKIISWETELKAGDTATLSYRYQAPKISPEMFLLGPLGFYVPDNWLLRLIGKDSPPVFEESRHWQLASDAESTIDSTTSTTLNEHKLNPALVFVSDQVGYMFYKDSGTASFGYSSTTDGGTTWKAFTAITAQTDVTALAIWYDRWTPDDTTGNRIHLVFLDTGNDDIWYDYVDVGASVPVQGTEVAIDTTRVTLTSGDYLSITKATNGTLFVAIQDNNAPGGQVLQCGTTCVTAANWSQRGTNPLDASGDYMTLIPLNNGNVMVIRDDISLEDVISNIYSATSTSWWGWVTVDGNAADSTTYLETNASTINRDTGDVYLAYGASVAGAGTADIRTAVWSATTSSWTLKTDVITNANTVTNLSIARDENNGDIYVAYLRGTLLTAMNAYYKKSTDNMATWGAETQFNTTSVDLRWMYLNMMSNERIYGVYEQNGATNDGLFGNTIADLTSFTVTQRDYQWYDNADSVQPGSALQNENTEHTITSVSSPIRLRMNVTVGGGGVATSSQEFALQYAYSTAGPWTNVGWWNTSWQSRQKITLNNTGATTSPLTDFAIPVQLRSTANGVSGAIDYSKTQNSGQDIRFVDANGTTTLPYEIEKWDESATSTVWVKVPKINNATTTDYIWMYYNNSSASDAQAVTSVWESTMKGVWHMGNVASSSAGAFTDSTSNANNGTGVGGSSLASTTGTIDGAYSFDKVDDSVSVGNTIAGVQTVSFWMKPVTTTEKILALNGTTNIESISGTITATGFTTPYIFVNGVKSSAINTEWNHVTVSATTTSISASAILFAKIVSFFGGLLDDIRMYSRTLPEAEVNAQYKAGVGTFLTYGSEELVSTNAWNFYNGNSSVNDGASITSTLLSASEIKETYESANFSTTTTQNTIQTNQEGEWDFALDPVNATSTTYYFRLVNANGGTVFSAYTNYPTLTVVIPQSITFSLSGNSASFGTLSSSAALYASSTAAGDPNDLADAHTISVATNAFGGYTVSVNGTTLTSGANTIATSSTAVASAPGTEQFGMRLIVNSGTGLATAPYASADWAFDSATFPDQVASGSGDGITTVFGVRYIGNISANTEAGNYRTTLTYVATATF